MKNRVLGVSCSIILAVLFGQTASAQTTDFTYQGRLMNGSAPANGNHDFVFLLFDAATGGTQLGVNLGNNVAVTNGVFSVKLDFGNLFPGANRFVEIRVKPTGGGAFTTLSPRQQVTSSPYSIRSQSTLSADFALNSGQLGGIAASQYVLSGATSINAGTQFNIGGNRVFSMGGTGNTFLGLGAGTTSPSGFAVDNSFFGNNAGKFNDLGGRNSFFGSGAGQTNTNGSDNSFFGTEAGLSNVTGDGNSLFGASAGKVNTAGDNNSFFGATSGDANTTGSDNSFFGRAAGGGNTTGSENAFFGRSAGLANTIAANNSYFGFEAGRNNVDGAANSIFGWKAGRANQASLNSFFGNQAGELVTSGGGNTFLGTFAGSFSTTGDDNTFVGRDAGGSNTTGSDNTALGSGANVGSNNLSFATAIGAGATVSSSNSIVLGRTSDTVLVRGDLDVIGDMVGSFRMTGNLTVDGLLSIRVPGGGGIVHICLNTDTVINICASSIRYKRNVQPFSSGLDLVRRLRPVSFNWKSNNQEDMGLIAEEVNEVEPLLVTYNDKGEIEGVKYDRVGVVLVNAVKEQQQQIESQQKQIDGETETIKRQQEKLNRQQSEIDALKALVCSQNPTAELCKPKEK